VEKELPGPSGLWRTKAVGVRIRAMWVFTRYTSSCRTTA
jgi:hypothetical protein